MDDELNEIAELELYLDDIPDYLALGISTEYQELKLEFMRQRNGLCPKKDVGKTQRLTQFFSNNLSDIDLLKYNSDCRYSYFEGLLMWMTDYWMRH